MRKFAIIGFILFPVLCLAETRFEPVQHPEPEGNGYTLEVYHHPAPEEDENAPKIYDASRYDVGDQKVEEDSLKDNLKDTFDNYQERMWEIQQQLDQLAGGYNPSIPSMPSFTPPVHHGGGDCMTDFQICITDASYDHADCINDGQVAGAMAGQNGGAVAGYLISKCSQRFARSMSRCERNRSRCEQREKFEELVDEYINVEDFINEILALIRLMEQGQHDFQTLLGNIPGFGDMTVHVNGAINNLYEVVNVLEQEL